MCVAAEALTGEGGPIEADLLAAVRDLSQMESQRPPTRDQERRALASLPAALAMPLLRPLNHGLNNAMLNAVKILSSAV